MAFVKGQSGNPNGRKRGAKNVVTSTIKEAVLAAFNEIQKDPKANLITWGTSNPKDFYLVAAKLIPTEIQAKVEQITVRVVRE